VAEHISKDNAELSVDHLNCLLSLVVFFAALPFQEGICHIYEQKKEYGEGKLRKPG
jgi:hypothetical protein